MELKFRKLEANEIDCRVSTINEKGLTLLLYKDARVDMNILDETLGSMNWQRDHKELKGNIYCGISIWDNEKEQWVTKWDCGKESFSDSEKGESSDSFKRAGFNWGIGRELYTAPFIWISSDNFELKQKNDKYTTNHTFRVKNIEYNDNREICKLIIENVKTKKVVYKFNEEPDYRTMLITYCKENGINMNKLAKDYGLSPKSTNDDYMDVYIEIRSDDNAS